MPREEDCHRLRSGQRLRRSRDPHVPFRRLQRRQHSVRHSHLQRSRYFITVTLQRGIFVSSERAAVEPDFVVCK